MSIKEYRCHVLIIDDDQAHAQLLADMIGSFEAMTARIVGSVAAGTIVTGHDIMLISLHLADSGGTADVAAIIKATTIPVIVITTPGNDDLGLAATRSGAHDYFVRGQFTSKELVFRLMLAAERHYRKIADTRLEIISTAMANLRQTISGLRDSVSDVRDSMQTITDAQADQTMAGK